MTNFASILNAWMAHTRDRVDLAEGTKRNYARVLHTLLHWSGDRAFGELSLTDFVRSRRRAGLADRTIHLELSILRIAVRWAEQERLLILATPLRLPRLRIDPRQFKANHTTPSPEEAGLAIASMPHDDWRVAVSLLARTGARVGEVVCLRSRDLDERRGTLVLGGAVGNSKTGSRTFPLDPHSLSLLRGRGALGRKPLLDFGGLRKPQARHPKASAAGVLEGWGSGVHTARAPAHGRWTAHSGLCRPWDRRGPDRPHRDRNAALLPGGHPARPACRDPRCEAW